MRKACVPDSYLHGRDGALGGRRDTLLERTLWSQSHVQRSCRQSGSWGVEAVAFGYDLLGVFNKSNTAGWYDAWTEVSVPELSVNADSNERHARVMHACSNERHARVMTYHVRGERGLVADSRGDTAQQGRHLSTGLDNDRQTGGKRQVSVQYRAREELKEKRRSSPHPPYYLSWTVQDPDEKAGGLGDAPG